MVDLDHRFATTLVTQFSDYDCAVTAFARPLDARLQLDRLVAKYPLPASKTELSLTSETLLL